MTKKLLTSFRVLIIILLVILIGVGLYWFFVYYKNNTTSQQLSEVVFEYAGNPINPDCLEKVVGMGFLESINLSECSNDNYKYQSEDGWLLVDYGRDEDGGYYRGFFQYKVLGNIQDKIVIASTENGGGTGYFDGIAMVKVSKNTLYLDRPIVYGDRCNGGIDFEKTKVEDGILYYSQKMTPADVIDAIELSQNPNGYNYPQLDSCTVCCTALAKYKYSLLTGGEDLVSITLYEEKFGNQSGQPKEKICFGQVYDSYIDFKKTELSLAELKNFDQKFLECLNSK